MRESPALDVMQLLGQRGAVLSYSDPFVPDVMHQGARLASVEVGAALGARPDCTVICTDHSSFDYRAIAASGALVVDTRNALKQYNQPTIFRL